MRTKNSKAEFLRSLKQKYLKKGVKSRLILYSVGLLLFNLCIIGLVSYKIASSAITERISETNIQVLGQAGGNIDYILKGVENAAIQVFDNMDLNKYINEEILNDKQKRVRNTFDINQEVNKLSNLRDEIEYVYIVGDSGAAFPLRGQNDSFKPVDEDSIKKLLQNSDGRFLWTYVARNDVIEGVCKRIALCKAIFDSENLYKGYILIYLRQEWLTGILTDMSQSYMQVYMTAGNDIIISATDKNRIGTRLDEGYIMNQVRGNALKNINKKKYLVSGVTLDYTGWKLYMVEPYNEMVSGMKKVQSWIAISAFICISVFVAILIIFSTMVTEPVKRLLSSVDLINKSQDILYFSPTPGKIRKNVFFGFSRRLNFKAKLSFVLIGLIIIPTIVLMIISYNITSGIVRSKVLEASSLNTKQMGKRIEYYLKNFEKSVYYIYSERKLIIILKDINRPDFSGYINDGKLLETTIASIESLDENSTEISYYIGKVTEALERFSKTGYPGAVTGDYKIDKVPGDFYDHDGNIKYTKQELIAILKNIYYANYKEYIDYKRVIGNVFSNMQNQDKDIVYVSFYKTNRELLYSSGFGRNTIDSKTIDILDLSDDVQNLWLNTCKDFYNQYIITLGKKVKETDEMKTTGYIFINLRETGLENAYKDTVNGKDTSFIVDKNGMIISHPDKSLLGKKSDYPYTDNILKYTSDSFFRKESKEEYLISYNTISNTGWKIVNVSPMNIVKENTSRIVFYNLWLLLIDMIIILMIILKISGVLSNPIVTLTRKVSNFAGNGHCSDTAMEDPGIVTGDEIEQLSISFDKMMQRIKMLIEEVYESQIKEKEAELTMLQAQINPHFLYNTLEVIRWKVMFLTNNTEITNIIMSLSEFFRLSLSKGKKLIPLTDEIEHAKNYLNIINFRYDNKAAVNWHIDAEILNCLVPKIILQPIIENSVHHGIKPGQEAINIDVYGRLENGMVKLIIADDGRGINKEKLDMLQKTLASAEAGDKSGYGLRNINQRIKMYFDNTYGLAVTSSEGKGTSVFITFPSADNIQKITDSD